jgi:hypothetical protein
MAITRLEKGDTTRTAMHTAVMNEIIDKLNTLLAIEVKPQGAGKFIYSDGNVVFENSAAGGCGDTEPPAEGTFVCGSVEGVKQWIETIECACGTIDGGTP